MSAEGFSAERDGARLRLAISAWSDGVMSDQEFAAFQATLEQSPDAREIFIATMCVHAGVQGEVAARQYVESVVRETLEDPLLSLPNSAGVDSDLERRGFLSNRTFKLVAASVIFLLGALAWFAFYGNRFSAKTVAVGRIVHETVGSEWSVDHDRSSDGNVIYSGSMIRVAQGSVMLRLDSGSVLTIHAPALYEVLSKMCGRALLGRLTARIAVGDEGYSVLTPRATVVDLGTDFGIDVDDSGATDVVVFEGLVDLNYQPQHGKPAQQRLSSGEAMHLDAYGTVSRIVSISNHKFSADGTAQPGGPVTISSVRDNIQRAQAWNYYEIVHAGMREDARAFVDRTAHEWNGVDTTGMPEYFLGGDYVKTFNNDKCRTDLEIVLTIDQPCDLYILFDDRIPAPAWLRNHFRNTGDKVGIDCGPWVYNGVASKGVTAGVGPGVSVDDTMSIWVRRVEHAGPLRLGATETPHDDLNMYGIVAVPLPGSKDSN